MTSHAHPLSDGAVDDSGGRSIEIEGSPVYEVEDWSDVTDEIQGARHPRPESIDEQGQLKNSLLPALDLPGFGQRDSDCGEFIPEAMRYCVECGDVKQNRHNCLRYDCPDHAPFAIRRRAAGSSSAPGIGPKLAALVRTLGSYFNDSFHYQHLFLSPGEEAEDFLFESDQPLERGKEICREIMDKLGLQGVVVYHPWSGDHEDPEEDDMGLWRTRLFHDRDWRGDVRDELKHRPHFHIIGVAPYLDISNEETGWEEVHEETGWILKRSMKGDGSKVSIENERDMATKLTYALSHAGIYETQNQRRLAAWFKGPDVNKPAVYESVKLEVANKIHAAAEDTLGIPAPSFKCEEDVPAIVRLNRELDREFTRASEERREAGGPLAIEPIGGFGGPNVDPSIKTGTPVRDVDSSSSTSSSTSLPSSSVDLDGEGSSSSWDRSVPTVSGGGDGPDEIRHDPDGLERCGGYVRHISAAGEYLLSREWRERAVYADDLESAYRSYVNVMTSKGLDPLEGEPLIPEETDPPPDEPPAD